MGNKALRTAGSTGRAQEMLVARRGGVIIRVVYKIAQQHGQVFFGSEYAILLFNSSP